MNSVDLDAARPGGGLACCDEPSGADLLMAVELVLFRLALHGKRDAGWPAPGPRGQAVDCLVRIEAPIQGYLSLRCARALAGFLSPGPPPEPGRCPSEGLLRRLAEACAAGGAWRWQLRPGRSEERPAREPEQVRALRLGTDSLELRFWPDRGSQPAF